MSMELKLEQAIEVLERTPSTLKTLLEGLSDEWITNNEGGDSWSPFDIIGHLVHGEKTDWIQRLEILLSDSKDKTFTPFDRFAQFGDSKGKTMTQLLTEFENLRADNMEILKSKSLEESQFELKAIHPSLGEVKLKELLAAWVAHDLGHIAQISRVMAKQYKGEVGPWLEYLSVLHDRT